MIRLDNI